ncbi:MAG: hypothetical protein AB7V36_08640 [Bacteroidales bacterium]
MIIKRFLHGLTSFLLMALILLSTQSCNAFLRSAESSIDKKKLRAERRAIREQLEEDEFWGGDDEYNFWEENEDYDRDRW